jgi:hypothetical protein
MSETSIADRCIAFYLENTTDNVANFCFSVRKKMRLLKKTVDSRFGSNSSFFFLILILLFHSKGVIR